jgi:hypothetical protein
VLSVSDNSERVRIIEWDGMTGNDRVIVNLSDGEHGGTYTREEAERSIEWRKANITSRYSYEIQPAVTGKERAT